MSGFKMSLSLLQEASALATNVPYLGAVAGILLQIFTIKDVRLLVLSSILSETRLNCALPCYLCSRSIFTVTRGKRSCTTSSSSPIS